MNAFRPKPMYFPWPPLVYALAIGVAFGLQRYSPLYLPDVSGHIVLVIGSLMIAFAVVLDFWALQTLWKNRTTVLPHRSTTRLVTKGPFQFTRNPIYLGYTILTTGLSLATSNAWLLIMIPVVAAFTHAFAIRREELHLLSRFGVEFERYCQRTRRWI